MRKKEKEDAIKLVEANITKILQSDLVKKDKELAELKAEKELELVELLAKKESEIADMKSKVDSAENKKKIKLETTEKSSIEKSIFKR